jgi:type VI secretion system protein ImpG
MVDKITSILIQTCHNMNNNFLEKYNKELYYLREMAAEFAKKNPLTAQYLSLSEFSCADPYIERLLEGFAFMAARVSHKLDAEFPRFTQALINNLYPEYFMPIPAMGITEFKPDYSDKDLIKGSTIPSGTLLNSQEVNNTGTECKFKTAHEIELWPISIYDAELNKDSSILNNASQKKSENHLRIGLQTHSNIKFNQLKTNKLDFYIRGDDETKFNIQRLLFANCISIILQFTDHDGKKYQIELTEPKKQLKPLGYDNKESLLLNDSRVSQIFRTLREYFAFENRFLFFRLDKINDALAQIDSDKVEILFLFDKKCPETLNSITKNNFSLYCTPIVNLFKKRLDRINYSEKKPEFLLNADKFNPENFEILKEISVNAYVSNNAEKVKCKPFYSVSGFDNIDDSKSVYYSLTRINSTTSKNSSIPKSEENSNLYISFVDFDSIPLTGKIKEIGVQAYCSNGKLPSKIRFGFNKKTDFTANISLPITGIKSTEPLTNTKTPYFDKNSEWQVINHIKLNHFSLINEDPVSGAKIITEWLKLYANPNSQTHRKIINSITAISGKATRKRVKIDDGIMYISGVEIKISLDNKLYKNGSGFILAGILDRIFKISAPINSFVETVLISELDEEVMRWPAMIK